MCCFLSFGGAVVLVILKPLFVERKFGISFINGTGIWILLLNIIILFDITAGIFAVGPMFVPPTISLPVVPPPSPEPRSFQEEK